MSQALAYKLVAVVAGFLAFVSGLAGFALARAGSEAAALGQAAEIDWAGFVVPALQVVFTLILSVAALLGSRMAGPLWRHRLAKAFCFGVPCLIGARLVASSLAAASLPPLLPAVVAGLVALGLVVLGLLVRPNIALKPTAGDVARSAQPPGPAAA